MLKEIEVDKERIKNKKAGDTSVNQTTTLEKPSTFGPTLPKCLLM